MVAALERLFVGYLIPAVLMHNIYVSRSGVVVPGGLLSVETFFPPYLPIYMILPIPSLSECRPPLTMCVGCDMAGRPCSPSPPCCSVGPLGRRGLSGRRTLLEVRHSLTTRQVRRWHRKASIDYELTFPCPVWHPHGSPPLLSPSVG